LKILPNNYKSHVIANKVVTFWLISSSESARAMASYGCNKCANFRAQQNTRVMVRGKKMNLECNQTRG
jgi:hypothetical protein